MKNRQSSLYGQPQNSPQSTHPPQPAGPPAQPPKRNYLMIFGLLFMAYAIIGEFFLPEPIRFTTIIAERGKNIQNIMIEGTADAEAQKQKTIIDTTAPSQAEAERLKIETTAPAAAAAELLKIETTAQAQAVAACMQARAQLAQQKYVECIHDRSRTGPVCDFIRDDILNSSCQ